MIFYQFCVCSRKLQCSVLYSAGVMIFNVFSIRNYLNRYRTRSVFEIISTVLLLWLFSGMFSKVTSSHGSLASQSARTYYHLPAYFFINVMSNNVMFLIQWICAHIQTFHLHYIFAFNEWQKFYTTIISKTFFVISKFLNL